MATIGKGVFRVELYLVDLERRQQLDEIHQRGPGRHFVTTDVQHHTPRGKIGPIYAAERRQPGPQLDE